MTSTVDPPNENDVAFWDEVRARLAAEADRGTPAAWMPEEPGDELFGVFVAFNPAAPTKFGPAPVATIRDATSTTWSLWLLHKVLRLNFERQRIALGERVLVRYLGSVRPEGGGNAYDNYAVIVDRPPSGSPDWDAVARRYNDDAELDERRPNEPPPPGDEDIPF